MKHLTALYTIGTTVYAVAGITKLSDGRLNVSVASKEGARWEPGNWTETEAKNQADRFARELLKTDTVSSQWEEVLIDR